MPDKPAVIFAANLGYALTSSRQELIRRFIFSEWEMVLANTIKPPIRLNTKR